MQVLSARRSNADNLPLAVPYERMCSDKNLTGVYIMKLTVNLEKDSYPIYIENNILSQAGDYIRKIYHGKRIMIISDDNVFPF